MARIEYTNVNANKLHDELIQVGITPLLVQSKDDKTWITFEEDVDMTAVQAVIEAHNSESLLPPVTDKERIAALEQALNDIIMMMI